MENQQLELLANKLGVATEYVFTTLVNQAPIESTITLIQCIIVWVLTFVFIKCHLKFSKSEQHEYSKYDKSDNLGLTMFIIGCILTVLNLAAFFSISGVINGYFNPEYWALNKILSTFKN